MRLLYHAAPQCAVEAIIEEGLRGFGGVYLADTEEDAVAFVGPRLMSHMHSHQPEPRIVRHDSLTVFSVDVDDLEEARLAESHDHSEVFFQGRKAWVYLGDIPADALYGRSEWAPTGQGLDAEAERPTN